MPITVNSGSRAEACQVPPVEGAVVFFTGGTFGKVSAAITVHTATERRGAEVDPEERRMVEDQAADHGAEQRADVGGNLQQCEQPCTP